MNKSSRLIYASILLILLIPTYILALPLFLVQELGKRLLAADTEKTSSEQK